MTEQVAPIEKINETNVVGSVISGSGLHGLIPESEIQKIQADSLAKVKEIVPNAPEIKPEDVANKTTETKVEETKTTEVKTNSALEDLKKTTFFADVNTTPATPVELKEWNDAAKYITDGTGIEVKEFSDIQKIVTDYNAVKETAGKAAEYQKTVEAFETIWNKLPDEVIAINMMALNSEDYRSKMKELVKDTIDYNVPFEKQDKKEMLDYYFPGKFSAEDYEDEDNKAISFAVEQAAAKYATEKKEKDSRPTYREQYEKKQEATNKVIRESAINSYNTFAKDRNIDPARKDKIGNIMSGGVQSIVNTFFDEKTGGWKPEAFELLTILYYAKEDIQITKKVIENLTKTATTEEMLSRGHDKPTAPAGGREASKLTPEQAAEALTNQLLSRKP